MVKQTNLSVGIRFKLSIFVLSQNNVIILETL
jgi:hypothetical protein